MEMENMTPHCERMIMGKSDGSGRRITFCGKTFRCYEDVNLYVEKVMSILENRGEKTFFISLANKNWMSENVYEALVRYSCIY